MILDQSSSSSTMKKDEDALHFQKGPTLTAYSNKTSTGDKSKVKPFKIPLGNQDIYAISEDLEIKQSIMKGMDPESGLTTI